MTEFEINFKVAKKLGLEFLVLADDDCDKIIYGQTNDTEFDPCNNIEQAWEIMLKYGITIVFQSGKYQFATYDGEMESTHKKPLVAAMLVFLEI